jgi:hypothetical protein
VEGADRQELAALFWREDDLDPDGTGWPFAGEMEDEETLRAAAKRVRAADEEEEGLEAEEAAVRGEGEDGLVLDGSQQDTSLQQR